MAGDAEFKHKRRRDMATYDDEVVRQMRDWIEDCDEDTSGRDRWEIIDAVKYNYEGGIDQFLQDNLL
jgi:hypothetical protein